MTTSQRELLMLLARIIYANPATNVGDARKIVELINEINAGSQDIR